MPVGLGCVDKPNVLSEMVFGDVPDPVPSASPLPLV